MYTPHMNADRANRITELAARLSSLTDSQLHWIEAIASQFAAKRRFVLIESTLLSDCMINAFGDALLIHHCFSRQALTKDKFEYVMEAVANLCGLQASLAPKALRGPDITIGEQKFSLKTQADKTIREDEIYISKFMELGKGEWGDLPQQLEGLRDQFIHHLTLYDRVLCLRALSVPPRDWKYELVEVPLSLLREASEGTLLMMSESTQFPKPGYCYVRDSLGNDKFQLYFDGGTERKLQIKHLRKSYCRVHATWQFPPVELYSKAKV